MKIQTRNPIETWAAWRKDEEARALSSSGGMASVISEEWVMTGGVVYGAAFVKPFGFQHIRCTNNEELKRLRGSKYVQSTLDGVYERIQQDLKKELKVLFIGTPCQVSAIRSRFRQYEKLFTVDLICHGTPTVQTLIDSLPHDLLSHDFDEVSFRNNNRYQLSFIKNERIVWKRPFARDLYMKGFFKGIFYRSCCYTCPFAKIERAGDLSLGDFWGLDMSSIDDANMDKGISLVLVNSTNGEKLFESVKTIIKCYRRSIEEAVKGNSPLRYPVKSTWRSKLYKALYPIIGFKWAAICAMPDIVLKNIFK